MCAHNSMTKKVEELAARYGRKSDVIGMVRELVEGQYDISAFKWAYAPVVTEAEEIGVARWGLVPYWVRTEDEAAKIRLKTFNARADTLFEKPSYRQAARSHRCLIPSTGFFEWRHEGKRKIPYFIYLPEEPVFSIAGIYDVWKNPETGGRVNTFSMITTEANPMMAYIHNSKQRMPAVLSRNDEERWLDPRLSEADVLSLLLPFDENEMEAYPVKNDFLRKPATDPSILELAGPEQPL